MGLFVAPLGGASEDCVQPPFLSTLLRSGNAIIEVSMAWIYLLTAGLLEVGWAIGLKYTEGFTRLWPSITTIAAMVLSLGFLALALKTLPVGTAYAVWTGIGAVGTVILGIYLFGEPATAARLTCIALILAGILGLKLVT
jgi:quaternary ammonium compound-resistance protein SugE